MPLGGDSSAPVAMDRNWSVGRHYLGDRHPAIDVELHQRPPLPRAEGFCSSRVKFGTRRALHRYDAH